MLLRLVAVLVALQFSGIAHQVSDWIELSLEGTAHHEEDCEGGGKGCPPGCSSCHCPHAGAGAIPASLEAELPAYPLTGDEIAHHVSDNGALPAPLLSGVFRPPELAPRSA